MYSVLLIVSYYASYL
uniref:Uncharacterized protein n=1 Tax=Rhizophora mucronata TaxID=61149 RepID=A0A2P2QHP2_RHIMU